MEVFDFLNLGAELLIAIAGFAGIIATFQFRDSTKVRRSDAVGLTLIVQCSLLGTFGFIIPQYLNAIGTESSVIWASGSGFCILVGLSLGISVHRNMGGSTQKKSAKVLIGVLQLIGATLVVVNTLNVFNVYFHREPGPVLLTGVWGMGLSGLMFYRLLLRPIWRYVREAESR